MDKKQVSATWVFHMIRAFRERFGYSLDDVRSIEKKYRVISFLWKHYELLHYYGNDYVVDDMIRHVKGQGGELHEMLRVG